MIEYWTADSFGPEIPDNYEQVTEYFGEYIDVFNDLFDTYTDEDNNVSIPVSALPQEIQDILNSEQRSYTALYLLSSLSGRRDECEAEAADFLWNAYCDGLIKVED